MKSIFHIHKNHLMICMQFSDLDWQIVIYCVTCLMLFLFLFQAGREQQLSLLQQLDEQIGALRAQVGLESPTN